MLLVECVDIKKYYSDRLILDIDNLKIYSGDRIGVVGLNGSGKTTLLNILCGKVKPEEGDIRVLTNYSYISQLEDSDRLDISSTSAKKFGINNLWEDSMSGGEKTRFKLAQSLEKGANLIFADEPTSNLDIEGIELLEKSLDEFFETIVLVSHDRVFMDKVCNKILEIDSGKIKFYKGNYTEYKKQKEMEVERANFEYNQFQAEKKKLISAIEETKHKVKTIRKTPSRMGNSEARLHKMGNQRSKYNLDKSVKSLQSRLNQIEVKEKPKEISPIKLDIETSSLHGKILISGKKIYKAFNKDTIFSNAEFNIYNGCRVALIGSNGSGKSTLIKMIISGDSAIRAANRVKIGYLSQSMDILKEDFTILDNVMESSIYDETFARITLSRLLFKRDDVYKKISVLSGGERVKVSFAKILLQDINVLILDEPTNYLDIPSLEVVEDTLKNYNKTLIFVSHDRQFVSSVATQIMSIENKKIIDFKGTYDEYLARKGKKTSANDFDKNNEILTLKNKLSQIIAKLSIPSKNDNIEELNKEYELVLKQIRDLEKR
ncbi:ABC transporter ATP-binding protein [Gottschalkia acidurici 9a]|uniref:ABC transporter ATP-binding protein n=1 Tax=Gottschalkia acidurici (strain ATCC 7906 / DSM 604 / BCRC 14475 / CIP 104303 / KCTC 5404 / NCIMB 10678 / 9a) TaxID=1128398 RepID=K0B0Z4_GOTA9|nr:ABC-F type ribosomal protection protein [Gottschalkia acidurici]AFS79693.1 ABC transporter ATP-binding protein [Gottschalkia acidurici 9a]